VAWLEHRSPREIWLLALGCITVFGAGDYLTRPPLELSILYVIPVSLVSYYLGKRQGLLISVLAVLVWTWALDTSALRQVPSVALVFDATVRLAMFMVVVALVDALRRAFDREQALARVDGLTGALNFRAFKERAELEMLRTRRYRRALTLIQFDLDGFKEVNDRLGHATGDEVLRMVVALVSQLIRRTDTVARRGGDEFIILLSEADAAASRVVSEKVRARLSEAFGARGWPVTASLGAVTCVGAPLTLDELVARADQLAYQSKAEGKNRISYATITPHPVEDPS
jgi:diguanylate cyclase (GGDEF)-like protein